MHTLYLTYITILNQIQFSILQSALFYSFPEGAKWNDLADGIDLLSYNALKENSHWKLVVATTVTCYIKH